MVSSDGQRVFVAGESQSGLDSAGAVAPDYATVAYDAETGNQAWVARYDGPDKGTDVASSLAVSPNGSRVFVTGRSHGTTTGLDYATVAYGAQRGKRLWLARYNGPGNGQDQASAIVSSVDGTKVFVTGTSDGANTGFDYATVAYDASSGKKLWTARHNNASNGDDTAGGLAISPDGTRLFVSGTEIAGYDYTNVTVAYDTASGTELWFARGAGGLIAVDPSGTKIFLLDELSQIAAYDAATGTRLWTADRRASIRSLTVSGNGARVFTTGEETRTYDAGNGTELWEEKWGDGLFFDEASSAASTDDGARLFVTGRISGAVATIAYDGASGNQVWTARYAGGDGASLALGKDGRDLFVAGMSRGDAYDDDDYATFAYDPASGKQLWASRYNGPGGEACLVPNVRGLALGAAKAELQGANCVVGRVSHAYARARKGRVIAQSPKAGRSLAFEAKVALVLSKGPKPRRGAASRRLAQSVRSAPGTILTGFGPGRDDEASAVAIQPDGRIVVAGSSTGDIALARYRPNGALGRGGNS